jgi:glycosyltransferase involved in cell wall biosynthesis
MRIGIDARFYGPVGKGLGRYTQEVVDNIIKINKEQGEGACDFVVFLGNDNYDDFVLDSKRVKKVKINIPWYSLKEQLIFPWIIKKENLDLIHFPHFNIPIFTPVKFVMTLHDLILTHFPTIRATTKSKRVYAFKNFAYRIVLKIAIWRAKKIITVSDFTKKDIISQFKVDENKIEVTYEGVANLAKGRDSLFSSSLNPIEIRDRYKLRGDFLLYVGNAYPHKNLEALLDYFALLREKDEKLRLVLVGKIDYFYQRLQNYAKSLNLWQNENVYSPVIFTGFVSDLQLEILYQEAGVYIFPSLYEGFGLPPLEAMAKGCPVLSSDRASLPEVLGDAPLYFNPEDVDDFLNKVQLILNDQNLRENMKKRGYLQSKKFSWWECANNTLNIYKKVLFNKK